MRRVKEEGVITLTETGVKMKVATKFARGKWYLLRPGTEEKDEENVLVSATKDSRAKRRFTVTDCTGAEKRRVCLVPVSFGRHSFVVREADDDGSDGDEGEDGADDDNEVSEDAGGSASADTGADANEDYYDNVSMLATFDRQGRITKKCLEYKIENAGNLSDEVICMCYFLVNLMNKREASSASGGGT